MAATAVAITTRATIRLTTVAAHLKDVYNYNLCTHRLSVAQAV
jgi:hypothetical protein